MALAARSSRAGTASDGRIPCPVCRQQIHPVAGRCKHCKTDLVKLREQQGVRATRVAPAMLGAPAPAPMPFAPAAPAPATARLSGQMAVPTIVSSSSQTLLDPPPYALPQVIEAPPALPLPGTAPYLYDESPHAEAAPARRARWPIFVAIGAGIAIVICILLLVLDDKKAKSSRTTNNGLGVGTDSMDTDVTPQPHTDLGKPGDPWGDPTTPDPTTPDPLQPDPYQPPAPIAPTPPPSTFNGTVPKAEAFYGSMLTQLCEKAKQCAGGATSGMSSMLDSLCSGGADLLTGLYSDQVKNGQCTYDEDAAGRCLGAIGSFDCRTGGSNLDAMLGASDCMTALSCPF